MTKWILSLLVAVAVAMTAPAMAAAEPAPTMAGDIPIAEAHWGGPPTQCTSLTVTNSPPVGDAGVATQPGPAFYGPCEMAVLEVGAIDPLTGTPYTEEYICLVTVHEEGHLHGLGHVDNPAAIMFGGGTLTATEVPECIGGPTIEQPVPPGVEPPIERGHLRMSNLTKILKYHRRHHVHRGETL